jgi:putative (di)nucleoside polyphosphate hydrolase
MARDRTPPRAYRRGVGLMLFNREGRVFVGRRHDMADAWQMPQGGIDKGESAAEAALRELEEEIGTAKATIIAQSRRLHRYDLPDELGAKLWRGRYRGQVQRWFALRFTGEDRDINLDTAKPEFTAWRWSEIDELPRLIVAFKRPLYEALVAEFAPLALALSAATRGQGPRSG